jgi:predicted P-loop ATPase
LAGNFTPLPGGRNGAWTAALLTLANCTPEGVDPRALLPLFQLSLDKMDYAGESPSAWAATIESMWLRTCAMVAGQRAALHASRGALEKLAPAPARGSFVGHEGTNTSVDMKKDDKGRCMHIGLNVEHLLERDHRFVKKVRFNTLRKRIDVDDSCPLRGEAILDTALQNWLAQSEFDIHVSRQTAADNLVMVARRNAYNPVAEYLDGLQWDGIARISTFLEGYCGATGSSEYLQHVSRKFFIAAVARGYQPGCKADAMLVLQGPGGVGKTRLVQCLANGWYASLKLDVHNKDSVQAATSNWLIELAELATLRRSDKESLKAFLTNTHDEVRMPYERTSESYPRASIFVGTTNDDEFLEGDDEAANRRFWPVTVTTIRLEAIEPIVGQLWAEAAAAFKAGEKWWFLAEHQELFHSETSIYRRDSLDEVMAAAIAEWYCKQKSRPYHSTSEDIARHVLSAALQDRLTEAQILRRIGAGMRKLGCKRERIMRQRVRRWIWWWPDEMREAEVLEAVSGKGIYEEIAQSERKSS